MRVWFLHSVVLVSWRFNFFYLESPVSGVQSLPSSFFLLVLPAYVLPRSPPSELRALLFKCLEQATFGSNFSAKSIFQRVIGQLMELFVVLLGRSCTSFGQMGHLMTLWQSREPPAVNVWSQKYDSGRPFPTQPSLVCYTAVFSSSPQTVCVEERCVTTLKTAV